MRHGANVDLSLIIHREPRERGRAGSMAPTGPAQAELATRDAPRVGGLSHRHLTTTLTFSETPARTRDAAARPSTWHTMRGRARAACNRSSAIPVITAQRRNVSAGPHLPRLLCASSSHPRGARSPPVKVSPRLPPCPRLRRSCYEQATYCPSAGISSGGTLHRERKSSSDATETAARK